MKNLNVKNAFFAGLIAYLIGVSAFLGSFMFSLLSDPEVQANLFLSIAIIPAAMLGAHYYYLKKYKTRSYILGVFMFFIAMILDALITVPVFVIPAGGDYMTFFSDPGFWILGLEYILAVILYGQIHKVTHKKRLELE